MRYYAGVITFVAIILWLIRNAWIDEPYLNAGWTSRNIFAIVLSAIVGILFWWSDMKLMEWLTMVIVIIVGTRGHRRGGYGMGRPYFSCIYVL